MIKSNLKTQIRKHPIKKHKLRLIPTKMNHRQSNKNRRTLNKTKPPQKK